MDLETLLKAIVPLAFLAIWALTALFNREGNAPPARTSGPTGPYGPRPGIPPRVAGAGPSDRPPSLRWGPQAVAPPTPKPGGDDDIIILDSPRPSRNVAPRMPRRVRSKPTPPVAPRPSPIVTTRIGMGNVAQNVNQPIVAPLTVEPLAATLDRPVAASSTRPVNLGPALVSPSALGRSLTDPQRLQEAILVNEILQPPLALRRRRG